jgi:hypothetical protein
MSVANYSVEIAGLLNDKTFIEGITTGWLQKSSNKVAVFKAVISNIFVRPRGVNKMSETNSLGITNREWQDFAIQVRDYLKANHSDSYLRLVQSSPLQARYNCLWPECSDLITKDILKLEDKVKEQQKVQDILKQTIPSK